MLNRISRCCNRPRERIHRPQTRRRKENNEEAMEKMRMIQSNLNKARDLVEALLRRERKKRDIVVRLQSAVSSMYLDPKHSCNLVAALTAAASQWL